MLAWLVAWLGAAPFVDGLRAVAPAALAAAAGIAVLTTVSCAWRWRLVARGLGIDVTMPAAVAAYYRSQFLNLTLPGGILGDVHRGVSHGLAQRDLGRGVRAVAWERGAGQAVQVLLTVAVLLAVPSPLRSTGSAVLAGLGAVLVAGVLVWRRAGPVGLRRAVAADLRSGVLAAGVWPGVVVASAVALAGYVVTFRIAADSAGVVGEAASYSVLVPVATLVLLAAAVPASVAGWGPREGAAAWCFGAVGLDPALGVTVSTVYGLMVLAAALPGAVVLVGSMAFGGRGG